MDRIELFKQLNQSLQSLGYPVAYHHFEEPVEAPFIVYYSQEDANFLADNSIYHRISTFDIEVYTDHKDLILEEKMHELFTELGIIYKRYEFVIKEEKLFMQNYVITI